MRAWIARAAIAALLAGTLVLVATGFPDWQRVASDAWVTATDQTPTTQTNAQIAWTVPAGERWDLLALNAVFNTSAVAGNRQVDLDVLNETGTVVAVVPTPRQQAASLSWLYSWSRGVGAEVREGGGVRQAMPAPELVLFPGWMVRAVNYGFVGAADGYVGSIVTYRRNLFTS